MKTIISTPGAPAAIGPYSQAAKNGGLLFTSGQIPLVPSTGAVVEGDIAAQARQSLENLKAIVAEAGATMDDIIKTTVFIKDMNDFTAINDVYKTYFTEGCYPARSCVQVARLPKDVGVEIEAVVALK